MAKEKKKKRSRQERRFLPTTSMNPLIVYVVGALGAIGLGAGIWGYWFGHLPVQEDQTVTPIFVLSVAGAVLTVAAIWLGTSADPAVRVGARGIARERGELVRMPWYNLGSLTWESKSNALVVAGKDEHDKNLTFKISGRSHAQAVAWVLHEAIERVPKVVDVPDDVAARGNQPDAYAGTVIDLPPPQVVGRRCAKSGRIIAFEPDARVCPRCERVYHKEKVPSKCKCGESLTQLRQKGAPNDSDDEGESSADDETTHEDDHAEA